jgi:hypothetical protein
MSEGRLRTIIADAIHNDGRLYELVTAACQALRDIVGADGAEVIADWSMAKDLQGRSFVRLDLSDFTGRVEAKFAPDEMENSRQVRYRLYRIWGDLLQIRSHKQLKQLTEESGSEVDANAP